MTDDTFIQIGNDPNRKDDSTIPVVSRSIKNKKDDTIPYVEIIGEGIEDGVIPIRFDWNDAFIKSLKANGYNGVDDNAIVQRWLILVCEYMIRDLEDEKEHEYE